MTNMEEWDKFLENLHSNALSAHRNSKEYDYQTQRRTQIDELLATSLSGEQKHFVEEILFEMGLEQERESGIVYRQGLRDSVWLLKHLGVLA